MEHLTLENQLCFSLYTASRLITQKYQDFLAPLELTYPQYLVLLILREQDNIPVTHIGKRLSLKTNTLTPLLKRMESADLIVRTASEHDERVILIQLTKKAQKLQEKATNIPRSLLCAVRPEQYTIEDLQQAKKMIDDVTLHLQNS